MDSHALACGLPHDHLQHPPRLARLCVSGRSKRHIFSHRDGARHLLHHPHRAPSDIPASPRGTIQARTVLPRRRVARVGRESQLHHMDAVRLRDLLSADVSARNEEHDELCCRDYWQRRLPFYVRNASPLFNFFNFVLVFGIRLSYFAPSGSGTL